MSLLARTRLVASLIVFLTLLLTGTFFFAHERMVTAQLAIEQLDSLMAEFVQLRTATFDYALLGGERPRVQADAKFRRLHAMLSDEWLATTISDRPDEERRLRRHIHETLIEVEEQFVRMASAQASPSMAERDRRTGYLFILKSQAMATTIAALHPLLRTALDQAHERVDKVAFTLGGLLVGLALLALLLLERQILRPLDQLRRAAVAISEGDDVRKATARLIVERNDEIGQLSKTLALMVTRLEDANNELESFAYSVSHDLRAPLRAIDGFSRKVVDRHGDMLDDEGRRLLQVVRDNAQRMGRLIDDLLAFSRMGRREIEPQAQDMDAIARGVAAELSGGQPGRTIEFAIAPLPSARGDGAMLRQVWVNLIDNAVKFSRRRQPARIEIGGRREGSEVIFWVRDNGAGFDMQYADKLFGVFQRLHRQDEFEGTGVGLAIAQRILHRHGGRIWGEGKPDDGATFWFAVPGTTG